MKQSGSGVYVFELAFEHVEYMLNTDFTVDMDITWLLHFDSYISSGQ